MFRRVRTVFGQLTLAIVVVAAATLVLWQADLFAAGDAAIYKVARGDSLRSIAAGYGITRDALLAANELGERPRLYRLQALTIPAQATPAPAEGTAPFPILTGSEYTVQRGDTVQSIARAAGVRVEDLIAANRLQPGRPLARGQKLIIPSAIAAPPLITPAEPVAEETGTEEAPAGEEGATDEAAEEEATEAELLDIVDTAIAAGDFTTLVAAVQAAGLVDALKSEGPLTVFAPTDAAFAALPAGTVDALLADPAGDLTQILLYHVVAGKILSGDLSDGLTVTTLQGSEIIFRLGPDGATVNDAAIIAADIETSNGVIHVIDAVILPPAPAAEEKGGAEEATEETASEEAADVDEAAEDATTEEAAAEDAAAAEETTTEAGDDAAEEAIETELLDLVDTAIEAGDFTTLVTAVAAAGLAEALRGEGPFTVFAPTDAAFEALPMGALNALLLDPQGDLAQILLYHVVAGKILSSDLSDGLTVTTLQGGTLVFSLADGAKVNEANIIATDIEASNGIIHVIDAVLLPAP